MTSKLKQFQRLGKMSWSVAKAGAHLAKGEAQKKLGKAKAVKAQIDAARELVTLMAHMKGPLMKLGQMISISDDMAFPQEVTDLFKGLQTNSHAMSKEDLEAQLKAGLGPSWRDRFKDFDYRAMASASIGQVHQATLKDGQRVVVKVQYLGITDNINADLENLDSLRQILMVLTQNKVKIDELIEELKKTLIEECDYLTELKNTETFYNDLKSTDLKIKIPKTYPELSTEKILVTELLIGQEFHQTKSWTQHEKQKLAQELYDYTFFSLLEKNRLHTDPQYGNYLFSKDRVQLLDFGSCRYFSKEFLTHYLQMLYALEIEDQEKFFKTSYYLGLFHENDTHQHKIAVYDLVGNLYLPFVKEGAHYTPDYNPFDLIKSFYDQIDKKNKKSPRQEFLLLDRALFGLYMKIRTWDVPIDWMTAYKQYRQGYLEQDL